MTYIVAKIRIINDIFEIIFEIIDFTLFINTPFIVSSQVHTLLTFLYISEELLTK